MDIKTLFVTGANGQLGRAVNKVYAEDGNYKIVNTDVDELDYKCGRYPENGSPGQTLRHY